MVANGSHIALTLRAADEKPSSQSKLMVTCADGEDLSDDTTTPSGGQAMAAQLNNIRLKLEEKRRRIEQEKRRMEVAMSRQRQQLGQQAFLQAVTRVSFDIWLYV